MALLPIASFVTVWMMGPEFNSSVRIEPNHRLLPELYRHIELAGERLQSGDWNEALAHSNTAAVVGEIAYQVNWGEANPKEVTKRKRAINDAMHQWETVLGGQIQFVDAPTEGIHINFRDSLQSNGRDTGGHAEWRRQVSQSPSGEYVSQLTGDIDIRWLQPNGKPMTFDQLRHIAMHEIGHVLGMADSGHVGDIMGPLDLSRPAKKLAPAEVEAMLTLRERALALRKVSLVSALRDLEGYTLPRATR